MLGLAEEAPAEDMPEWLPNMAIFVELMCFKGSDPKGVVVECTTGIVQVAVFAEKANFK